MKVEAPYDIEAYLERTQELSCLDQNQSILTFIEEQKEQHNLTPNLLHLFTGEEAFYQHHYKSALQQYLQAKNTLHYEFFCFRASAYLSEEINNYLKAIQFAKKALCIRPEDHPTLTLLARTYASIDQRDKAQIIKQKLEALTEDDRREEKTATDQEEPHHFIPVGEQELEELSQIFSTKEPEQTDLFSSETSTPKKHTYETDTSPEPNADWRTASVVLPPGCDLFSHSPKPWESEESLTKRLYETIDSPQFPQVPVKDHSMTNQKQLEDYHQLYRRKTNNKTDFLFSSNKLSYSSLPYPMQNLLTQPRKSFFVHWQGQGIVINPGKNFLDNLHQHSLFLQDIQAIIVTEATPDSLEELNTLYTLSSKLSALHLTTPITFYVHPRLYEYLKLQWKEHQQVYSLVNSWNIHERIHCSTCHLGSEICGINLHCKGLIRDISIVYLTGTPTELKPCDILIMDASQASAEHILAMNPKITVLYNTKAESAHKKLHHIKKLRNHIVETNRIIPLTDNLNIQLENLHIQTEEGETASDVSALCAVATSSSTIELVQKDSIIQY